MIREFTPYMEYLANIERNVREERPVIDMWEMDGKQHVFGFWYSARDAYKNRKEPDLTLVLSLGGKTHNYPGNPTTEQCHQFFMNCVNNPLLFNEEEYFERVVNN